MSGYALNIIICILKITDTISVLDSSYSLPDITPFDEMIGVKYISPCRNNVVQFYHLQWLFATFTLI